MTNKWLVLKLSEEDQALLAMIDISIQELAQKLGVNPKDIGVVNREEWQRGHGKETPCKEAARETLSDGMGQAG